MPPPAPSREALRVLARLCNIDTIPARRHGVQSRLSIPSQCRFRKSPALPQHRSFSYSQPHPKTTPIDAQEPHTSANDPTRFNAQARKNREPSHQGTVDPQHNASSPTLPDITNYYTLFPKTLPGGPPQPPSPVPDSSTLVGGGEQQSSPAFHINARELRTEFLQLQSLHHPDKFPAGSKAHQRAYALSTLLNAAYKTLADPLLRAQYLLQLQYDVDVTTEDNSAHQGDQEDLMVVLEAQEDLEGAAESAADDGQAQKVVDRLKEENSARMRTAEKRVGDAFESGDVQAAKDEAVRLKYWHTLDASLKDWMPGQQLTLVH